MRGDVTMIFGNINEIEKVLPYLDEDLKFALQYLKETDFAKVENGEYELDGRRIYAGVNTYQTEGRELKKPEAHNKYIDVQFLGKGCERIYYASRTEENKVVEDYAETRDLLFFEEIEEKNSVVLNAGYFTVLFPWELHRPGCQAEKGVASDVQKVVIKILKK